MRFWLLILILLGAPLLALPQHEPTRPDVFIRVKKAPTGADYVWIQMVAEDYPVKLLEVQCQAIGTNLGGEIRGLEISMTGVGAGPGGKEMKILGAFFAVDGLADAQKGVYRINPLTRAFAGTPPPYQIDCLSVLFEEMKAIKGVTIGSASAPGAEVTGQYDRNMRMIEYRVTLKSQTPSEIDIPEMVGQQTKSVQAPSNRRTWLPLVAWVAGAAVLTGGLVYFALRPRPVHPPGRGTKKR